MPLVKVSLFKGKSKEEKEALLDAIHAALMEAFKIPENDRNQRIYEFEPENFEIPEGKTSNYTLIEMDVFLGRSIEAKRKLYQTLVQNLQRLNIQAIDILIVLNEPQLDNWSVRGGVPASETDLGFRIDV